ncbi:MAG: alanine racemase [Desulfitobacterium hafniense]|nr:alanine racemase [Desulfitobacterium hafniense]
MNIYELDTPCVLIDEEKMISNISRMAKIAVQNRVNLRPHTKTHKVPEIARIQVDAGAAGITVAKVSEAEVMADNGLTDIFIAYPIIGEIKVRRVIELNKRIRLIVGVDSLEGAKALSDAALTSGKKLEIRLEIDTGMQRTGVLYDQAKELALEILKLKGLNLTGIYTFRGLIYNGKVTDDCEAAGFEEGRLMADLAEDMRSNGVPIQDVSVGSTPTSEYAAQIPGVTEIRPGTYVFNDSKLVALGVCSIEDCAASILVTAVSKPVKDLIIIDGGSKTFCMDTPVKSNPGYLEGHGYIKDHPELVFERFSEEHGMIRIKAGQESEIQIGDKLQVIPTHICTAINLHNKAYLSNSGQVVKELPILTRGMVW